jgi:hypothetical protein
MFPGCVDPLEIADGYLPIGAKSNTSCANGSFVPLPELYCLFGRAQVAASIDSTAISSDPVTTQRYLQCAAPALVPRGVADNPAGNKISVQVGMNPYLSEYSNALRSAIVSPFMEAHQLIPDGYSLLELALDSFIYASLDVRAVYPSWGMAVESEDVINVVGYARKCGIDVCAMVLDF